MSEKIKKPQKIQKKTSQKNDFAVVKKLQTGFESIIKEKTTENTLKIFIKGIYFCQLNFGTWTAFLIEKDFNISIYYSQIENSNLERIEILGVNSILNYLKKNRTLKMDDTIKIYSERESLVLKSKNGLSLISKGNDIFDGPKVPIVDSEIWAENKRLRPRNTNWFEPKEEEDLLVMNELKKIAKLVGKKYGASNNKDVLLNDQNKTNH